MKTRIRTCLPMAIVLAGIAFDTGCAKFHHKVCREAPVEPALVDVGGQVHEPREIQIDARGLTLHRALVLSGGARDLLVAQDVKTFDPENDGNLQKLIELGSSRGVKVFHQNVVAADPMKAALFLTTKSQAELGKEIEKIDSFLKVAKTALSKSLDEKVVKRLCEACEARSGNEERLRVYDKMPEYFEDETRENIQAAFELAKNEERRTFAELSNTNSRTWQQSVKGELFVSLDRPTSNPPVRYYFPYEFVVSGLAGEIELQNRDIVEVVDVQDTDLVPMAQFSAAQRDIAIQGAVQSPGVVTAISTMGEVHRQGKPTITDSRGVWMLVRSSEGGMGQRVFVLPDRMVTVNGAAANAPTMDGDVYTYTILPQVPIVLESLVVRSLSGAKGRHCDRLKVAEKHREKKADRVQARQAAQRSDVAQSSVTPLR